MFKTIKAIGTDTATNPLTTFSIKRRGLLDDDVEMDILYCGICHSDLHQLKNDFGAAHYPMVPGHEIVGRVTSVGRAVTRFQPGYYAAVGCIVDACGECPACRSDLEQFCESGTTLSFNSPDKHLGGMTYGVLSA